MKLQVVLSFAWPFFCLFVCFVTDLKSFLVKIFKLYPFLNYFCFIFNTYWSYYCDYNKYLFKAAALRTRFESLISISCATDFNRNNVGESKDISGNIWVVCKQKWLKSWAGKVKWIAVQCWQLKMDISLHHYSVSEKKQ